MRKKLTRLALFLGASSLLFLLLVLIFGPRIVDRRLNRVYQAGPYDIPANVRNAYKAIPFIADLHGDSLLWKRDLSIRHKRGHIDIPRMLDANIALQVFCIVSQSPRGQNEVRTDGDNIDRVTLLSMAQLWPFKTWSSRLERALYQSRKLHSYEKRLKGRFAILENQRDLTRYIKRRKETKEPITAGLLAIEGAQVLEGKIEHIDVLFKAGFRMMAATHFFDNRVGGSAHGVNKGGLTALGRQMVKRMDQLGMIIDLAHVSQKVIDETLAMTKRPVVVSHTGVRGTCPNDRNLHDRHIKAIAKNGGIIGIGLWKKAICGTNVHAAVKAMRYVADLVGAKHVALGSDFDGSIKALFDITGLPLLLPAMKKARFTTKEIHMILGGNFLRIMRQTLPAR